MADVKSGVRISSAGNLGGGAIRRPTGDRIADGVIMAVLIFVVFLMVFPFYNMLLISFAKYEHVAGGDLYLWPKSITLESYRLIFLDPALPRAFFVTIMITVMGVSLSMFITTMAGYSLSKKQLPFRNTIFFFVIVTMYFSGGLVPWYLVCRDLGFVDSILVMVIPPALNTFYMILMKNYFLTIPESLEESARMDGANDIRIMFQIVIPIAAPIMATISLFYAVERWNEWWFAMLFIKDYTKIPLQLLLRRIVIESTIDLGSEMANQMRDAQVQHFGPSIQMATVTVTTIPILLVYPFLQKHFTKGIMLGAIKA